MRVPGLIFADEKMLRQIAEEQALEQVANVATLPGIVGYSLAMPDIHWGYGFPVGGVAAFRIEDGIISPGGIGYDLNCLSGEARVLHQFGFHVKIRELQDRWSAERIKCAFPGTEIRDTQIVAFLEKPPSTDVYKVTTEIGRDMVATGEHPFLTPSGMVPINNVPLGGFVAVYPFEGVAYEAPTNATLVDEENLAEIYPGNLNGFRQITAFLRALGLLPLKMDNPKLPYLIKLLGFLQGDGCLSFLRNGESLVSFYGEPADLEDVRRDVAALGFRPSRIYRRQRSHRIETTYGVRFFEREETSIHCRSRGLALLLHALGAIAGTKAQQDFSTPFWLNNAPRWFKRLYLAALFGAELTSPSTVTGHPYNFCGQFFSLSKRPAYVDSGRRFLEEVRDWLREFEVNSNIIRERQERVGRHGDVSVRLRLQISSDPANLVRLWTRVGFEYNRRKQHLGCVAAHYLRLKSLVIQERQLSIDFAKALRGMGLGVEAIAASIGSPYVRRGFVSNALQAPEGRGVRIGIDFPGFWSFLKQRTRGLGETGQVWDVIIRKQQISFNERVYDLTVADQNHNFIANSFVVSNCGVRLIRTTLDEDEVREKLQPLVDTVFAAVPSGVGSTGRIKVSMNEIDNVLKGGARWAVKQGYGWQQDLETIEAGGALEQADPDTVSPQAKQRGRGQVGTLGSGNHFLEVQVVDQIYDVNAASAMGIDHPGQVVLFVHCGSRGLGHQVCTDYLRTAERSAREHGINLVDRQLACMPFRSPEGQQYFGAMSAAANFAWANRQMITHWVREAFSKVFSKAPEALGLSLIYDVAHNIGKIEPYAVDGETQQLIVHRKGATRAFPAGHPEIPEQYRSIGQPVLVPGDMGRYSFIAVGTEGAMRESFGSTCHGAGRVMGRKQAVRTLAGVDVATELKKQGIIVRAQDRSLLAEEASQAYKDVADVVAICHAAGISKRVARTKPIGVVKG
ncbi:MAG: RtcB family protein [Armatimonadetes bacterium]|nr:RtcB family protein [Armatimonadota bacterium]